MAVNASLASRHIDNSLDAVLREIGTFEGGPGMLDGTVLEPPISIK